MNSANNQRIVIGYAVIDKAIDQKLIQSQKVNKVLVQPNWYINDSKYKKYNWAQIFKLMIQSKAEKIFFQNSQSMLILKQIQHVYFSQLKQLWLPGNCIQNIQPMTWIQFWKLQVLSLGQTQFNCNNITQIKCIDKLYCPQLWSISLNGLPLIQIKPFVRSKLFCQQNSFNNISLERYSNYIPVQQDLSIIVKLQTKKTLQIEIGMEQRIKCQKVLKMLHKRFSQFLPYCHQSDQIM